MNQEEILKEIKSVCGVAKILYEFENSDEAIIEAIKNMNNDYLDKERNKFRNDSIGSNGKLKPVNFIKYVMVDRFLNGKEMNLTVLKNLKSAIINKKISEFNDYPDFAEALTNAENKIFFQVWDNAFKTLFFVYYDMYKDKISNSLLNISEYLKSLLDLKNAKVTLNGFGWNNNFGNSNCWIALYPQQYTTHKKAYQIFLSIDGKGSIKYGVNSGSEIEKFEKLQEQNISDFNFKEFDNFMLDEARPSYIERITRKSNADKLPKFSSRNIILYGPPGTGKTYSVFETAVNIVEPNFNAETREELIKKFNELKERGYIEFVTFHQSFSYEEFIEGIRYNKETGKPEVFDGIFKRIVRNSIADMNPSNTIGNINLDNISMFKLSLGNTLDIDDDSIYDYCIKNDVVALGWGGDIDYTSTIDEKEIKELFYRENKVTIDNSPYHITAINYFKNSISKGDLIFVSGGNRLLRAIGRIEGDYFFDPKSPIRYKHFRKIKWFLKNQEIPVEKIMKKNFSQMSIYEMDYDFLIYENIKSLLTPLEKKEKKNYALIIDEINRGNISKIFGELMTLIEDDKRLSAKNEIRLTLPHSQEKFGVPLNIYIIGTMNTADRSIALMDIALRRRFEFVRIEPNFKVVRDILEEKEVSTEGIEIISKAFETINKKIEITLDKDHLIGHSFFMEIEKDSFINDLHNVWYKKIIPLILEYFYNDWQKIKFVLGEHKDGIKKGFVRNKGNEFTDISKDLDDDLIPHEIFYYPKDENFLEALKNTFGSSND